MKALVARNHSGDLARRSERRRSERVAGFVLNEVTYPVDLRLPEHTHPLACIALTLDGYSIEAFGSLRLERPEETVLYRPPEAPHSDFIGNRGARCFVMEFDESHVSQLAGVKSPLSQPAAQRRGNLARLALRVYREWLQKEDAHQLMIQALAHEMIADFIRHGSRAARNAQPLWLRRVRDLIDECFGQDLALNDLADAGGVHPVHLARSFRRYYGTSVGDYLRHRRIDAASDRLLHTSKTLTEIALESGFSSHGHFCTAFRRVTGLTPSEFRQLRR